MIIFHNDCDFNWLILDYLCLRPDAAGLPRLGDVVLVVKEDAGDGVLERALDADGSETGIGEGVEGAFAAIAKREEPPLEEGVAVNHPVGLLLAVNVRFLEVRVLDDSPCLGYDLFVGFLPVPEGRKVVKM